jgi:hypothetical protein
MPAVSMEEQSPSVAKAISPTRSDYVRAEARTLQRLRSVVSGVVVDRVRSYFCSPARDGDYGEKRREEGQPDLRDLFALRIEETRADQAVPYSPVPYSYSPNLNLAGFPPPLKNLIWTSLILSRPYGTDRDLPDS